MKFSMLVKYVCHHGYSVKLAIVSGLGGNKKIDVFRDPKSTSSADNMSEKRLPGWATSARAEEYNGKQTPRQRQTGYRLRTPWLSDRMRFSMWSSLWKIFLRVILQFHQN